MKFVRHLQKIGRDTVYSESRSLLSSAVRPAAVVAPLVLPNWESGIEQASLLFIKRASHLKKHAGQIAFPGGVAEKEDRDLLSTGFREGFEEVGLRREESELLAELPSATTPSGFLLKPFFVATTQQDYQPQESEVEKIHLIPIVELMNCPARCEQREWQGESYRVVYFETPEALVWGVTGRITELLLIHFFDWKTPWACE